MYDIPKNQTGMASKSMVTENMSSMRGYEACSSWVWRQPCSCAHLGAKKEGCPCSTLNKIDFYVHIPKNQTGMTSTSMVIENMSTLACITELRERIDRLEEQNRFHDERLRDYMESVDFLNESVIKRNQENKKLNRMLRALEIEYPCVKLIERVEKMQKSLVKALRTTSRLQQEKDTAVHKSGELYRKNRELADLSVSLSQMTGLAEQREEQCQARDDETRYHQWKLIVESHKKIHTGKDHVIKQLQEANNDLRRQLWEWTKFGDEHTLRSVDLPDELTFLDQTKANSVLAAFLDSHPRESCAVDCLIKNNSLLMGQIQEERRVSKARQETIDHMHSARDWNDYHSDDSTNYDRW